MSYESNEEEIDEMRQFFWKQIMALSCCVDRESFKANCAIVLSSISIIVAVITLLIR